MRKIFFSYSYIGQMDGVIYNGFGNAFIDKPKKSLMENNICSGQELLEEYTALAEMAHIQDHGFDTVSCTILYFKEE